MINPAEWGHKGMKEYEDVIRYLNSFQNFEISGFDGFTKKLDLSRVFKALERMGRPDRDYRSIHVAGTKGKGSVCAYTASILCEAGYKVGMYTSPHLRDVLERIKIDDKEINKDDLIEAVSNVERVVGKDSGDFTYFEILTLAAISVFSLRNVDIAVFETGLGGRLDATNVIEPEVTGITPISFDHTDVLGGTIEKIASEKAGIIKNGMVCVLAPQDGKASRVIEDTCSIRKSGLLYVGKEITYKIKDKGPGGSVFDLRTPVREYKGCRTGMPGFLQVMNAAQAVSMCEQLLKDELSESAVKTGIEKTFIPGRLEILSRDPLLLIDGAHNADSAEKLKYSVEQIFKYDKLILLLGLSKGKDIAGVCSVMGKLADHLILTRSGSERAVDPHILRGYFKGRGADITGDVKEALGLALFKAGKKDLILAAGSFYVIGEVRTLVMGDKV